VRTFFIRRVQLLRQWEMTMWMYMGPSCPEHPFSEELGDTEFNIRVHGVLAHGVILNLGTGPVPLTEGVDSPWGVRSDPFRLHVPILVSQRMCVLAQGLKHVCSTLWGSPYLRMRRGGRPTMSTMNSCRHGGKGDGLGAPPRRWQGHGGRTLPLSLNPREGMTKRRMKTERRGK
jgi:hypothetical protein